MPGGDTGRRYRATIPGARPQGRDDDAKPQWSGNDHGNDHGKGKQSAIVSGRYERASKARRGGVGHRTTIELNV
jgi:hypothetical protein